jgi:hypothetical protein
MKPIINNRKGTVIIYLTKGSQLTVIDYTGKRYVQEIKAQS